MIPAQYLSIEPQFPSFIDYNHFGLCLRASCDLPKGTIVATADFEPSDKPYVAGHDSEEHKYVAVTHVTKSGMPSYGKVRGKWAFCNHSCDPNCNISPTFEVITNRAVKKEQELTTSYDGYVPYLLWPQTWNFECLCQAPSCKKFINKYRMDIIYPAIIKD